MEPFIETLSTEYPELYFSKINIDTADMKEIVSILGITSLPTFCFFIDGNYVDRHIGADGIALNKKIINVFSI
jgi:thioredoxin-like negative regulator of GroEL